MHAIWYAIVAVMLTAWAVLDGFDFGAGIVHRAVARNEVERRTILAAIGPLWDGNEVWLVAAGGVFAFAFPRAYATALSGMYLALVLVLWLLVFRGIAIEFRGQLEDRLWRAAWDSVFAFASTVMAFVAGVALANVVRGVPLDASGWFHLDFFASAGAPVGAIDSFTVLVGVLSVVVLGAHGATFLAWKTEGELGDRATRAAQRAWWVAIGLTAATTIATAFVRPSMFVALTRRPWAWPLPALTPASAVFALVSLARARILAAFVASSTFIASLLLATAATLYPVLLPSTVDPRFDLDAATAASGSAGLAIGLTWWMPALALAVLYLAYVFRSMPTKITPEDGH